MRKLGDVITSAEETRAKNDQSSHVTFILGWDSRKDSYPGGLNICNPRRLRKNDNSRSLWTTFFEICLRKKKSEGKGRGWKRRERRDHHPRDSKSTNSLFGYSKHILPCQWSLPVYLLTLHASSDVFPRIHQLLDCPLHVAHGTWAETQEQLQLPTWVQCRPGSPALAALCFP